MKSGNVVQEKSYAFVLRIVRMYRHLTEQRKEFVLSKQILRSGTSIGANVEEAIGGSPAGTFLPRLTLLTKKRERRIAGCAYYVIPAISRMTTQLQLSPTARNC